MDVCTGIEISGEQIQAFCLKWRISELSLFGSVLRDDFGPESDVDALVAFLPEANPTLFHLVRMQNELRDIFGRQVDIISHRAIETSRNRIRRKAILESARVIYAAKG